jgi:M6 family metalloprotease-like protein
MAAVPTPAWAAARSQIGTDQPVLVICVRYTDAATTRRTDCADWIATLEAEVDQFFDRATFGQTSFRFETPSGGPTNGWYDLGYPSTSYDFWKVGQDAINLADANIDMSRYDRVTVITNWPGFGGQGGGPWWWHADEGVEATFVEGGVSVGKRLMTLSIVNEWEASSFGNPFDEAGSVIAHELGHHLGTPTHYADVRWFPGIVRDVITPWDIMGLSPTLNHFLGWPKLERTWLPGSRVEIVGPPTTTMLDRTVRLQPLEIAVGPQLIRVPLRVGAPFYGYQIENRRQINGDERLPSGGVLLTLVDESPNTILKTIVLDDPGSVGDNNQAALEVGDSYVDGGNGVTIDYQAQNADIATVRIRYAPPPNPNPSITPWGAPPWETPDIWIDSERNGWGTYRYTDGGGQPAGNGDDAWVAHANRVHVRVRNTGPGPASTVRAEVYVNSPPGMGDAGAAWDYLGTIVFPSIAAGGSAEDFVLWTPTLGQHTCLKVVILDTPNETSTVDNRAQENVSAFDTTDGSPFKPVLTRLQVNNPFPDRDTEVIFHVRDIPDDWGVLVDPPRMTLKAGTSDWVAFGIFPSPLGEQDDRYRTGYLARPKIEAQVPYADTFIPIGGVEVWTHLVDKTSLDCKVGRREGERRRQGAVEDNGQRQRHPPLDAMGAKLMPRPEQPPSSSSIERTRALIDRGALVRAEPPPFDIAIGDVVLVSGRLDPDVAGSIIAVELFAGETRAVELTKTDGRGNYAVAFRAPAPGIWQVQASFAGDMRRGTAQSRFCRVLVR